MTTAPDKLTLRPFTDEDFLRHPVENNETGKPDDPQDIAYRMRIASREEPSLDIIEAETYVNIMAEEGMWFGYGETNDGKTVAERIMDRLNSGETIADACKAEGILNAMDMQWPEPGTEEEISPDNPPKRKKTNSPP